MTFELWHSPGCFTYFPRCPESGHRPGCLHSSLEPDAVLIWTYDARSPNDAHRALHAHLGWEPYRPMLDADGQPYPEDEAPFE